MAKKTALITDVMHFIGRAGTQALLNVGYNVVCHDLSFTDDGARAAFEADYAGAVALAAQTPADIKAEVEAKADPLTALIANSAYPALRMPIEEADLDKVRETFEQLFFFPYELTKEFVPTLKAQGGGKIVYLTSSGPAGGIINFTPYAAARSAVNGMIRTLALELARDNIQVNAIAPNYVYSEDYYPNSLMNDPVKGPRVLSKIPVGRLGKQEEVAAMVRFLVDDQTEFFTGQVLNIAGGWV